MLDLLISYFNLLILSIGYIVKRFTFFPPDPPDYKSIPTKNKDEEDIQFLIQNKKNKVKKYLSIEFRHLDYRYIKIIDKDNNSLPLLLFCPPSSIPVCIIYSHGNSGDLGSCLLEYYDIALNTNCIVISFEYPGYGECKNQPLVESQFNKNLQMTYYFVKRILGFKSEQIILYGFSLGTGIMFELACTKQNCAAGLILQSPFLSIIRTLYNVKKTRYFDLFNNCDKAKHLYIKTFFIHGNKDTMVPYIHGRILAKLIPQKYFYDFLTVNGANHNNIFKKNKELIYKGIRQFIKDCTGYNPEAFKIKEVSDNKSSDDYERDSNKGKENISNNLSNNSSNKLNKIGEKISPKFNLINYNPNLNTSSSNNKDIKILINNNNFNYHNSYFNNNLFKNVYPFNSINNFYNLQNQNNFFPFSQTKSEIFKSNTNEINNMQELAELKPIYYNNNYLFNNNNIQGNLNNGFNPNNNTNSTLMGLNQII